MLTHHRRLDVPPAAVWEVLADGWLYPLFVVGTTSMRGVDASWPEVDAQLHHSTGAWPLLIRDSTVVTASEAGRHLEVLASGWPFGRARVVIDLVPDGAGTRVGIAEDATAGPSLLLPRPLRQVLAWVRNGETLRRLDHLVRGRAGLGSPPGTW